MCFCLSCQERFRGSQQSHMTFAFVQNLMERAVVLGFSANHQEASPALASLVNEYASLLASQVR